MGVSLPPEQTAIVRFLDDADQQIRRYIRAKQKLIALLEEQKQAIIHQAVTGRIDIRTGQPYPTYKPSGVEWLGEVPEHWDIRKLRQCATIAGGMTPSMENQRFWNGSIPWVTPKDMKREAIGDSRIKVAEAAVRETPLRVGGPSRCQTLEHLTSKIEQTWRYWTNSTGRPSTPRLARLQREQTGGISRGAVVSVGACQPYRGQLATDLWANQGGAGGGAPPTASRNQAGVVLLTGGRQRWSNSRRATYLPKMPTPW